MPCGCSNGFDHSTGGCCRRCPDGRQRAYRLWLSFQREREAQQRQQEIARAAREAVAMPWEGREVKVSGHDYGWGR